MTLAIAMRASPGNALDMHDVQDAVFSRHAGEHARAFGARFLAERYSGLHFVHPPVEGDPGSGRSLVVLLGRTPSRCLELAVVLAPTMDESSSVQAHYAAHELPDPDSNVGASLAFRCSFVRAVMFENTDADPARELLILIHIEGSGPADDEGSRDWGEEDQVAVYDWHNGTFVFDERTSRRLAYATNAAEVRRRLLRRDAPGAR